MYYLISSPCIITIVIVIIIIIIIIVIVIVISHVLSSSSSLSHMYYHHNHYHPITSQTERAKVEDVRGTPLTVGRYIQCEENGHDTLLTHRTYLLFLIIYPISHVHHAPL